MRIGAAQRKLSRSNGERFLAPSSTTAYHTPIGFADTSHRVFLTFDTRPTTVYGGLGKISATTPTDGVCLVRVSDDPGPRKLPFSGALHDFEESCKRFWVSTNTLG